MLYWLFWQASVKKQKKEEREKKRTISNDKKKDAQKRKADELEKEKEAWAALKRRGDVAGAPKKLSVPQLKSFVRAKGLKFPKEKRERNRAALLELVLNYAKK